MIDLYTAILAQTTLDAIHWHKSRGSRYYPWRRRSNPSRLEAFQAWRWCCDLNPRYAEDRETICEAVEQNPEKWVGAFGQGKRLRDLERWARAVLRQ